MATSTDVSVPSPIDAQLNISNDMKDTNECTTEIAFQYDTSLAWLNLHHNVAQYSGWQVGRKTLLHRLNGHFRWHSLNGVLGPSGAGKTTLLNCLSGNLRLKKSQISSIYLSADVSNPHCCMIEQQVHESIVARLTVGQILSYAYQFKNGRSNGLQKREETIHSVCRQMMLDDDILGRFYEQCSGGEQKRVAIAQELVSHRAPDFLFIDEPTSGLDSAAAFLVMSCLKRLSAEFRMSIIVSVHVPNDQTLALFDSLYIMARGGVCIYSGPPKQLAPDLEKKLGLTFGEETKPIEVAIKLACNGVDDAQVVTLANDYLAAEFAAVVTQLGQLKVQKSSLLSSVKFFSLADLLTQTLRQLRITFIASYRTFFTQLLFYVFNLLVFSSIFDHAMVYPKGCASIGVDLNSTCHVSLEERFLITENINYLGYTRFLQCFLIGCSSCVVFASMAKVFQSEYRNRWYSVGVFYWSLVLVSILELTIFVIVICSVGYFTSEQHAVDDYAINWTRLGHYTGKLPFMA